MAPRVKITEQMIIEAAKEVIRERGYENLNVRTIAERLSCSTQPVLYHFRSMEEIRTAAYQAADAMHTAYILPKNSRENPLLEMGMNYIRFASEEKNLFRFLFQSGQFSGVNLKEMISDPQADGILSVIREEMNLNRAQAQKAFLALFIFVHGAASLLANNSMEFEEKTIRTLLKEEYERIRKEGKKR